MLAVVPKCRLVEKIVGLLQMILDRWRLGSPWCSLWEYFWSVEVQYSVQNCFG